MYVYRIDSNHFKILIMGKDEKKPVQTDRSQMEKPKVDQPSDVKKEDQTTLKRPIRDYDIKRSMSLMPPGQRIIIRHHTNGDTEYVARSIRTSPIGRLLFWFLILLLLYYGLRALNIF